ncbi:endonuclease domain-containing protein [Mycobacteroides saopaulense]|uniref:endonuclease domain-containing protein n=1 Tax=Mycobacteroides saopaulense TaxID=1578165 RepID=UPI000B4DB5C4|nr:DUF559 domain-containing protein [Mycobacteroides saopaulense]
MGDAFIGTELLATTDTTRWTLETRNRRVYPDVYVPNGIALTAANRAVAAWLWSKRTAVVAGLSAAALLGSKWISPDGSAELASARRHAPDGITLHRDQLAPDEYIVRNDMSLTTPARTAFDIGRRMPFTEALIHLDALCRATGLRAADAQKLIDRHRGARGTVQLRELLGLVDGGAESPQETRTRLVLVRGGLPMPQTQIQVIDEFGWVFARIDMGWEQWKVGVEFDGAQHWTDPAQRAKDIERLAELESLGWRIIRVSSDMLRRPPTIVDRVADALHAAGWRGEMTMARAIVEKRPA